jgi:ribosome-binding factor A
MSNNRISKLNSLVQDELSKIIQKKIDFEKGVLVTIYKVEVSADTAHANIHISVIPENNEKKALETLKENVFLIQQELNKRLVLRIVPKIRFVINDSIKRAANMEEIFKEVVS